MRMRRSCMAAALLLGCPLAHTADPRVCALRNKDLDGLKGIVGKLAAAGQPLEHEPDASAETLRALLYERMQGEIPGSPAIQPWPGPGVPGECDNIPTAKPAAEQPATATNTAASAADLNQFASKMFQSLDVNHDGQLTRAEMQSMIDTVNAAAKAKGEPEHDLFKTLDRNEDGVVDRQEAESSFAAMAAAQAPKDTGTGTGTGRGNTIHAAGTVPNSGGARAAGSKPGHEHDAEKLADGLFRSLDKDGDGRLSQKEFEKIMHQYTQRAKSRGEKTDDDFWASIDVNKDGYADRNEAGEFIAAMVASVAEHHEHDEL